MFYTKAEKMQWEKLWILQKLDWDNADAAILKRHNVSIIHLLFLFQLRKVRSIWVIRFRWYMLDIKQPGWHEPQKFGTLTLKHCKWKQSPRDSMIIAAPLPSGISQ